MLSRLSIAALIFSLGNVAYAAVTIAAPEVIDVLAVNDQEVKITFYVHKKVRIKLMQARQI